MSFILWIVIGGILGWLASMASQIGCGWSCSAHEPKASVLISCALVGGDAVGVGRASANWQAAQANTLRSRSKPWRMFGMAFILYRQFAQREPL